MLIYAKIVYVSELNTTTTTTTTTTTNNNNNNTNTNNNNKQLYNGYQNELDQYFQEWAGTIFRE